MHPSAERLYMVAKSLHIQGQSAVARWLNEAPQTINNWEKRGVSKRGAVELQKRSGYSAAWILEGVGAPQGGIASAPPGTEAPLRYDRLSSFEQRFIRTLRAIADEAEKRRLLKDLSRKAARRTPRR